MCAAAHKHKIGISEILRRQIAINYLIPSPFRNSIQQNKLSEIATGERIPSAAVARISYAFGHKDPLVRDVQAPLFRERERYES